MYGAPAGVYDPSMAAPPGYGAPAGGYDPSMGAPPGYAGQGFDPYGPPPMGGPMGPPMGPPMGMDPMQAQAQAEAELQMLEAKKKEKEDKRKEKEIQHMTHQMRTGSRNQTDNEGCAMILCMWGILNGLLWAVALLGDSWWTKVWHGMSVDKLTITVGLFNMNVQLQCQDRVDVKLCMAMQKYAEHDGGNWAIKEIGEEMCKGYAKSCPTMDRMYNAGFIPLFILPAAAALEVICVLLLYFYWKGKPTSLVRNLASKSGMAAPFIGGIGFVGWFIYSPYMQELPRFWAGEGGDKEFANSSLFGMKEAFTLPMGWCTGTLLLVWMSSAIRFFVQFTLPFHINEPDPYNMNESARLLQEADKMYSEAEQMLNEGKA